MRTWIYKIDDRHPWLAFVVAPLMGVIVAFMIGAVHHGTAALMITMGG